MVKAILLLGLVSLSAFGQSTDPLIDRVEQLEDKINSPQQRPNLFNPGITAFGNMLTCAGQNCGSIFQLREVELDVRGSIDPWADGVIIIAVEGHDGHFHVDVEEGYAVLKKLPILDDAPWGLTLKAGRYLQPFGRFNQIHLHDLPQINQPLVIKAFLDDHAFSRVGFSGEFFIPTPGENNSLRLNLNLINGGGLAFINVPNPKYPAGLGHLSWFWDLAAEHDLEVGLSAYVEHNPANPNPIQLYGTDINYKWRPYHLGDKKSFLLGGELFVANGFKGLNNRWPLGFFVWSQYQLNQWFYPSVRYSYAQGVKNELLQAAGVYLTYYTTEFLRLRAGYEYDIGKNQNQFLFELNFVLGSHPVEPYWVNR
ncbi:MAG: hypothetical protein V4534_04325 [Myxococcota bacterium]